MQGQHEELEVEQPVDDTPDWGNLSDRELLEFIATNMVGLVGLMQGIRDQVAPTLERMGPALKMMGLGG